MLRLVVLSVMVSACLAAPVFYSGEPYVTGHLAGPAVVAGHHLPPPLVKTYTHPPLYGAYPAVVKAPVAAVVTPAVGFVKAPIVPAGYGLHGGHYGHVSPYLH
ncbi:UNVERIFIED_CONTAM: hypothetical protein PYX00_008744 [Menopon gallinae]|uniref:Uncharacterized protein n=1 Tax=Menopon gallinae TaxID=328185 RepID=A0AAW2HQ68_9NEOP